MKRSTLLSSFVFLATLPLVGGTADSRTQSPPSLEAFADAIHHWRNRHGSDYARHSPDQVEEIADNLLLYQRRNGGWVENRDPTRVLSDDEKRTLRDEKSVATASFDNRNIYSQVEYLSAAYMRTRDRRYREAAERGIEFTLSQQHRACGGWPHTVPPSQPYHGHITSADEVTSGVLRMLRRISERAQPYGYVDPDCARV